MDGRAQRFKVGLTILRDTFHNMRHQMEEGAVNQVGQPPFDTESEMQSKQNGARAIAVRQGQPKFRKGLLEAFGQRCCLSGCAIQEILEAAHTLPYAGKTTNDLTNGRAARGLLHALRPRPHMN